MSGTRSVLYISLLTPVAIFLGLTSNWYIVHIFGLSSALDAYFIAILFPTFLGGLISEFLGRNFIPTLDRLKRERGEAAAEDYTCTVISYSVAVAAVALMVFWLTTDYLVRLVAPSLTQENLTTATNMTRIMLSAVIFITVNVLHEYMHQLDRRFFRPQLAQLAVPTATLVAVASFGKSVGEMALPWAFLIGHTLIFVALLPGLHYRFRFRLKISDTETKHTLASSAWLLVSGTLSYARTFIERYAASHLGAGAVSALALASRICSALQQVAGVGMKIVTFRNASALMAAGNVTEAGRQCRLAVSTAVMLLAPISIWLSIDADLLMSILFSGRKVGVAGLEMLIVSTRGFLLATPLMAVGPILSNMYFLLNRPIYVAIMAPISLALYATYLFLLYEHNGLLGIALATLLLFVTAFIAISWHLSRIFPGFERKSIWRSTALHLFLAMAMVIPIDFLVRANDGPPLLCFAVVGATSLSLYFIVLFALKDETFRVTLKRLHQRKNDQEDNNPTAAI